MRHLPGNFKGKVVKTKFRKLFLVKQMDHDMLTFKLAHGDNCY